MLTEKQKEIEEKVHPNSLEIQYSSLSVLCLKKQDILYDNYMTIIEWLNEQAKLGKQSKAYVFSCFFCRIFDIMIEEEEGFDPEEACEGIAELVRIFYHTGRE